MKLDCEIIRDLLPLYAENMVSEKTKAVTEEHLAECTDCRQVLETLRAPQPDVQFRVDSAQQFVRYEKKQKRRFGLRVFLITLAVLGVLFIGSILKILAAVGLFSLSVLGAKVETDTDPAHYAQYMGENAREQYRSKWGMDETIFPAALTPEMQVQEYSMTYYDPWDAQFLSYLTVCYSPEEYAEEVQRLADCPHTGYDYYCVTGFPNSEPLAVFADSYHGFVYAINTPDTENSITYVEIIFCNFALDIDAENYIPADYLPVGFDAGDDNPYRREQMKNYN